jgi:hypothetical protein
VEINVIPETQEDEDDIELPAPAPVNTPAAKVSRAICMFD